MDSFFVAALKALGNPGSVIALVCLVAMFWIIKELLATNERQSKAIQANTIVLTEIKTLLGAFLQGGNR